MEWRQCFIAMMAVWSCTAGAHHVWLEQEGEQVSVYFGEFGLNLREVSSPGGLLNKLSNASARLVSVDASRDLVLLKGPQAYTASARPQSGESIVAEVLGYPLYDQKTDSGTIKTWYRPAARLITDFSARTPLLELDVVPTGVANQFAAYFKGKPLARTAVKVISPSGWTQEIRTNREGVVTVSLPWASWYAIQVSHKDATPGQRAAESYREVSHVLTLTLRIDEGLTSPAPPAQAAPYIEKIAT